MRKLFFLAAAIALIAVGSAGAQTEGTYKVFPGVFFEEDRPAVFGAGFGANLNIYYDSTSGFTAFTDQGGFFTTHSIPEEREGFYIVPKFGKRVEDVFGTGIDGYAAIGYGDMHIFRDGDNLDLGFLALDLGVGISNTFSVALYGWYVPSNRGGFTGLVVNLMPWF